MPKVKVTVPATATNIGPGLGVVGLALSMHATIEMSPRADGQLHIAVSGEGEDVIHTDFYNPVLRAATRVFQRVEKAPAGLDIRVQNDIPWDAGLGADVALHIGGIIAASNLIDANLSRADVIRLACDMNASATSVTAALLGALSVVSQPTDGNIVYDNLDVVPLKVIVAVPYLPNYQGSQIGLANLIALEDAIFNMGQTALMIEALRTGDFTLLSNSMGDRLHQPNFIAEIPWFDEVQQAVLESGGVALVVSGSGPALLAIAEDFHESIAEAIVEAFASHEIAADTFVVGVDRQGITLSITA